MKFTWGKYRDHDVNQVIEIDPFYIKWCIDSNIQKEILNYIKSNKSLLDEIDRRISISTEKNQPFILAIEKHIMMAELVGQYRGVNFLKSIRESLKYGRKITKNALFLTIDILSRGPSKKPIRRNSKKYLENKNTYEEYASSILGDFATAFSINNIYGLPMQ